MSKEIAIHCDSKIRETDCQEYEDSDDENIDVGSNYNESMSDNEPDIELTRDEDVVIKKVGVRSFGIDDILNHTNSKTKDVAEQRHKTLELRSPLDALFSLTTSFESMKQKSDKLQLRKEVCSKKKRKSRTAFTNHQIFELEKRFLYLHNQDQDLPVRQVEVMAGSARSRKLKLRIRAHSQSETSY